MTFYYVGGDGGADGGDTARFASRQTGTFPASSYSTVEGVLDGTDTTTDIAVGDTICVKDTYANSQGTAITLTFHGTPTGNAIRIESVDATEAETLKAGASEATSGSADIFFNGPADKFLIYGMTFDTADNMSFQSQQSLLFRGCTFAIQDSLTIGGDGINITLEDCTIDFADSGTQITLNQSAIMICKGVTTSGFAATNFINGFGDAGGIQLYLLGCDFTALGTTANIVGGMGNAAGDDAIFVHGHNCEMLSGQTFFAETPSEHGAIRNIEAIGCGSANAYSYEALRNYGQVLHSTSTYVTSDTALEGGTNYSYQINTTTNCSKAAPFRWALPVGYVDLSVASTDTIRVRITSATSLTQDDVAVFVGTSNTTTNTQMDFISSAESKAESSAWIPDHTATGGTALATDASEWTNAQTNEYAITVTPTNVDATSPLAPTVWLEVYTDVTFFVSSQLVFEA